MNIQEEAAKKAFIEALKNVIRAMNPPFIAEQKCKLLDDNAHVASILVEISKLMSQWR